MEQEINKLTERKKERESEKRQKENNNRLIIVKQIITATASVFNNRFHILQ